MKWRQVSGIEAIHFARVREIVETSEPVSYVNEEETVFFTDGTAIRVRVDNSGFQGSDLTPPDPATVVIEIGEP